MGVASDYQAQLLALAPPGRALPSDPNSVWGKLQLALANEFARVEASVNALLDEMDPRTTSILLADWERVAGLPDTCVTTTQTTDERRGALVAKLASYGGQSRQYFIDLAAHMGYTITITEFRPHTCEHDCEHPVYDDPWAYAWQVNAPLDTIREATCESGCEDPLRSWGNAALECAITKLKPAHTTVIFAYS